MTSISPTTQSPHINTTIDPTPMKPNPSLIQSSQPLPIAEDEQAFLEDFLSSKNESYKRRLINTQAIQGTMERICPRDRIKIDKDAVTLMREVVTEFIGFLSSEAIDRTRVDQREEIDGDDIVDSLRALGFGLAYTATAEHGLYLQRVDRKLGSKKFKGSKNNTGDNDEEDDDGDEGDDDDNELVQI
jgi:histone H3/H4